MTALVRPNSGALSSPKQESVSIVNFESDRDAVPSKVEYVTEAEMTTKEQTTKIPETTREATTEIEEEITRESTTIPEKTTEFKEEETTKKAATEAEIETEKTTKASSSPAKYTAREFRYNGVEYWNGWRWTWYSQNVLPGGGLKIPGRHVDENGYVCDEDDNIVIASSVLSKGTIVNTPFGKQGKIYDSGCASNTLDVYTNW